MMILEGLVGLRAKLQMVIVPKIPPVLDLFSRFHVDIGFHENTLAMI